MKVRELIQIIPANQTIDIHYYYDISRYERFLFKGKNKHLKESSILDCEIECFFTTYRKNAIHIILKKEADM